MLEKYIVEKSSGLSGKVVVSGSKNAALPIMAACLLTDKSCIINNVAPLSDIFVMKEILEHLGAQIIWNPDKNTMSIHTKNIRNIPVPIELMSKIRASFLIMGPLLARFGLAEIAMPGGCNIGLRPIDLHLKGFSALGADNETLHGKVISTCKVLRGEKIYLDFPSVGATENIMMAATLADGVTTIENAATEPEIVDLANFLNSIGAHIRGAGTDTVKITGVQELNSANYTIMPDRIEAGTYMAAVSACGGNVKIEGIQSEHLKPVIAKLREMNIVIEEKDNGLNIISGGVKTLVPTEIKTMPHPGFPTDLQAQMTALLVLSQGSSIVTETVFENRFMHVPELMKMGANIKIVSRSAIIEGVDKLSGATLTATDLRAGAALVIAALCAEGHSKIEQIHHIQRGYYNFENKLAAIGAAIYRVDTENQDSLSVV